MSPTYSAIRYYDMLKSCMIFFIIQAFIVFLFFPPVWDYPVYYRLLTLSMNIIISVFFGWHLYKQRYHIIFSYDDEGFILKKGKKEEISHKWSEFSKVSLIRTEHGDFSLRLHNSDFFDLPVSKLKLNPFEFRTEATRLMEANKRKKSG